MADLDGAQSANSNRIIVRRARYLYWKFGQTTLRHFMAG